MMFTTNSQVAQEEKNISIERKKAMEVNEQ